MTHSYSAEFQGIQIKPMSGTDSERYRILRNSDGVREAFFHRNIIQSEEQMRWYDNYTKKADDYMFSIYDNGVYVGGCGIYNFDRETYEAEFGRIIVNPQFQRMGIAHKAILAVLTIAFEEMNVERVYVLARISNRTAISLYERLGFVEVGESGDVVKMIINKGDFSKEE